MTLHKDGYSFHATRLSSADWPQLSQADRSLGPNYIWIEGIGSFTSPVTDDYFNSLSALGESRQLQECSIGNHILYRNPGYSPSNIHALISPETNKNYGPFIKWYDLSGRRISVTSASSVPSVLPKGVYIRDGKKVAVK